jgi:hypothetical protein
MLSLEESKNYLKDLDLSHSEVEAFRNAAYSVVNDILDELYETETNN